MTTVCAEETAGIDTPGSCFTATVLALSGVASVFGVIVATGSVFNLRKLVVLPAEIGLLLLMGSDSGFGAFFLLAFLLVGDLDLNSAPGLCRFNGGSEVVVVGVTNFLFVPLGLVVMGAVATPDAEGAITRSGERLVDETTLAAFTVGSALLNASTVGATTSDLTSSLGSSNIKVRLLKEVEGRKAPKPSSSLPSFLSSSVPRSEELNNPGISFMTSSSSSPPPTTAAL